MITLQTILVYTTLFILMFSLFRLSNRLGRVGQFTLSFISLLLYSIVFGMRYGVGADFFSYLEDYVSELCGGHGFITSKEGGFDFLKSFFISHNLHSAVYLGFIAFLQLGLLLLSLKNTRRLYPAFTIILGLSCIWLSYSNGLRQQIAFGFFALAVSLLNSKKNLPVVFLLLLCATQFHTSAYLTIIIALFLLIFNREWFINAQRQIVFWCFALIVSNFSFLQNAITGLEEYMELWEFFNYDSYFKQQEYSELLYMDAARHRGIGFYINISINAILILYSSQVKSYFNNGYLNRAYNLYFVGSCIAYALISSQLIQRINVYFYGFQIIVATFTIYYFSKVNRKLYYTMLALLVLVFVGTLYRMHSNTAAYYFFWQQDLL